MANVSSLSCGLLVFLTCSLVYAEEEVLPECSPNTPIGFEGVPASSPFFSWNVETIPEVFFHDYSSFNNKNTDVLDEVSRNFSINDSSSVKYVEFSPSKNLAKMVVGYKGVDYYYIVTKHSTQKLRACGSRDRINFSIDSLPTILSFAESDSVPKKCMISSMTFDLKASIIHQFSLNVECSHPRTEKSAELYSKSIEGLMNYLYD